MGTDEDRCERRICSLSESFHGHYSISGQLKLALPLVCSVYLRAHWVTRFCEAVQLLSIPFTHNPALTVMSYTHPTATSSSTFKPIFDNALKEYQRRTKKDLLTHPLASQLQACDSPGSILALLQQQVQELDRLQSGDDRLIKWLDPTVNVLYALSDTLGEGVGLVCFRERIYKFYIIKCI